MKPKQIPVVQSLRNQLEEAIVESINYMRVHHILDHANHIVKTEIWQTFCDETTPAYVLHAYIISEDRHVFVISHSVYKYDIDEIVGELSRFC